MLAVGVCWRLCRSLSSLSDWDWDMMARGESGRRHCRKKFTMDADADAARGRELLA